MVFAKGRQKLPFLKPQLFVFKKLPIGDEWETI